MTIKSFEFSENLWPNIGLIDPGPLFVFVRPSVCLFNFHSFARSFLHPFVRSYQAMWVSLQKLLCCYPEIRLGKQQRWVVWVLTLNHGSPKKWIM